MSSYTSITGGLFTNRTIKGGSKRSNAEKGVITLSFNIVSV